MAIYQSAFRINNVEGITQASTLAELQKRPGLYGPITTIDDLPSAIAAKKLQVRLYARALLTEKMTGYSAFEAAAWLAKVEEAKKFKSTLSGALPLANYPLLNAEAQARGITLATLIDKVLKKAAEQDAYQALISGRRGKHCDAIGRLTTVDAVNAYDFTQGWT